MDQIPILFSPMLPPIGLEILSTIVAVISIFAIYRRTRGTVLRLVLFAFLLLALANPSLVHETREPLKDTALVVIDDSASMKLGVRTKQAADAADAIAKKLAAFSDLDVETIHVSGDEETDLFHAIEIKQKQIPSDRLAGVIAITDGQIHDAPTQNPTAPFHALLVGKKDETDRRVTIKSAPAYAIVGQKSSVTLRVDDEPKQQTDIAAVTISRDDGSTQTITVPVGKDVEVKTDISHAGQNNLAFEVEALPNEITAINNTALANINGIRDRLRVLLISGQPSIAARQWLNLLKSDATVDLVHFTILRSQFKDNSIPNKELSLIAFPSREVFETKLHKFDLVIFDGFSNRSLMPEPYMKNIADYVEHGGALLVSNTTTAQSVELGNSPLARVLPTLSTGELVTGSFVPTLSDTGKRHPVTATLGENMLTTLWSPWYRQIDARPANDKVETLLTGLNQKPLLVLAHVGQGRVAQFLSNQFWLWSRQYPTGGPGSEMMRRTSHWLMKEPELDETALRAHAELHDGIWQLLISKQSLHGDTENVVVTGPDNQPVQVKLSADKKNGVLKTTADLKQGGLYHVKDDDHEILVMAGTTNAPEFGAMVATAEKLSPIAETSDGGVMWLSNDSDAPEIRRTNRNGSQHGSGWIGLRKNGRYRVTGSDTIPLWPAWLALSVLLATAMWAWRREGR